MGTHDPQLACKKQLSYGLLVILLEALELAVCCQPILFIGVFFAPTVQCGAVVGPIVLIIDG